MAERDFSEYEPCVCAGDGAMCKGECPILRRRDAIDAVRWRMLPAFIEEHQIDYARLLRQIDEAIAARAESQEAAPAPTREVPPGKWRVDMPDGSYGKMPGDPPGPASVRAVIGGYVYDVEPRTGKLRASEVPSGVLEVEGTSHDDGARTIHGITMRRDSDGSFDVTMPDRWFCASPANDAESNLEGEVCMLLEHLWNAASGVPASDSTTKPPRGTDDV